MQHKTLRLLRSPIGFVNGSLMVFFYSLLRLPAPPLVIGSGGPTRRLGLATMHHTYTYGSEASSEPQTRPLADPQSDP